MQHSRSFISLNCVKVFVISEHNFPILMPFEVNAVTYLIFLFRVCCGGVPGENYKNCRITKKAKLKKPYGPKCVK